MANLLFEIGTEEIPAKFMPPALKQLKELAEKKLKEQRLKYKELNTYGTPRRIVLEIKDLDSRQEDLEDEVKGPSAKAAYDAEGNLSKAALGFAKGQGVDPKDLQIKDTPNGQYVFANRKEIGKDANEVLKEMLPGLALSLYFPKPMRWGDKETRYARPIRWLVALLDTEIIPFEIEGIHSDRITRGHRFLGSDHIMIKEASAYFSLMKDNYVIVDQAERKKLIVEQIIELNKTIEGKVESDENLLNEIVYLVEYPTALVGGFSKDYLEIPKECIITPMKEHQRYFPVLKEDGELLPMFVTVRNGDSEHLDIVRQGNEKVLKARLDDAKFFFDEDRKKKLEDYVEKLKTVVFQAKLGTIYEKVERIEKGAKNLIASLNIDEETSKRALRAAYLAKADLETNMVYEFSELQGIMGSKYALYSGENEIVAKAIFEHYLPRNADDFLPETIEGTLISIADKIDTITGCFLVGIEPTGSQDPYALRRQALGICKILLAKKLDINLTTLIARSIENYAQKLEINNTEEIIKKIYDFFELRVRNILTDANYRYDVIEAIISVGYDHLNHIVMKAEALNEIKGTEEFTKLLTAFTRANNLAKKAESIVINEEYLVEDSEKELYQVLTKGQEVVQKALENHKFKEVLQVISKFEEPINKFFADVMVMDKDEKIKNNRLALLKQITLLVEPIADLTKIVQD
ncbi:glycyl-tRNA synthetase beta chain [Desulfonispora thiosulfatigenes DSM 11270]|uniref:Glycine--tRNA ligase beta subunit n=1 Tax=Desulfonispora thiosulfatigenes DSM 11270 TaxID=656914 RepID=A0A1W1VDY5_DESTI|nr:glycine--tRNA ligase subunit beta [Desulfonispora thiosulfatigenes]SMB91423.1 glycyl-tRNA synthetase beta chain [Desulfonispora thiosulfatigenes DSM 11270]